MRILFCVSALLTLSVIPASSQSVLICGTPKGCIFARLGQGLSYDQTANTIIATPQSTSLSKIIVDTFPVNCSTGVACPGGNPQAIFRTSQPVRQFLLAFRAITQSEGPTLDYDKVANADGTWTVTFKVPLDTGTVILFYTTPCPAGGC